MTQQRNNRLLCQLAYRLGVASGALSLIMDDEGFREFFENGEGNYFQFYRLQSDMNKLVDELFYKYAKD